MEKIVTYEACKYSDLLTAITFCVNEQLCKTLSVDHRSIFIRVLFSKSSFPSLFSRAVGSVYPLT